MQKICIPAPNPPQHRSRIVIDFDDEPIEPGLWGPRVRDRPRPGLPRELRQSQAALEAGRAALKQCYRWARSHERTLQGVVQVAVRIDPFGAWTPQRVVPEMPGGGELAGCVGAAVAELRESQVTPRNTEWQFRIRFVPSSQRPPRSAPPRPAAHLPHAENGPACLWLPTPVPIDRLAPPEPLLEIDDYDVQQAREDADFDYQQQLAAWQRGGKRASAPRRSPAVQIRSGALIQPSPVAASEIRRSLRYNQGAYGACYAQALARHPGLAGRVVLNATVDHAGSPTVRVQQSNGADAALEECLRQAVAEVWFEPWNLDSGRVEFNYSLLLVPAPDEKPASGPLRDTIAGIEARAQAQLNQADGNAALRSYSALLRQLPDHPHRCQWQAGALAATLVLAPWQDDRVLAAATDLVGILAQPPGSRAAPQRSACLSLAAPLLTRLATDVHRIGERYRLKSLQDLAVQRYQLALRVGPDLPGADALRYSLAEALGRQERYCEATPVYVQVALNDLLGPKLTDAALAAYLSGKRCLLGDPEDLRSERF